MTRLAEASRQDALETGGSDKWLLPDAFFSESYTLRLLRRLGAPLLAMAALPVFSQTAAAVPFLDIAEPG